MKINEIINSNNKKLERACTQGDLKSVIYLTTSSDTKELIDPACGFNYPLRGACIFGHINVVDFLINFPDEEIRKKITSPENITAAIKSSADYAQNESFLYFKKNFPKEYYEVLNDKRHNQTIDKLTMGGNLHTIELLMQELPQNSKFDYSLFIEKSIQYEKMNCFDFFFPRIKKKDLHEKKSEEKIIHTALYHERFEYFDKLMTYSKLNLSENITLENFQILLEVKFDSLKYIVFNYDYQPNKKITEQIDIYLEKKENTDLTNDLIKFKFFLEKQKLKQKLEKDMAEKNKENKPFKKKI